MVLKGEAAWICLMLCNADGSYSLTLQTGLNSLIFAVLFSVVVLHWVTSKDSSMQTTYKSSGATGPTNPDTSNLRSKTKFGFDSGLRTHKNASSGERTVTTHISARGHDPESDVEDNVELKKIRVQVKHTVERGFSRAASRGPSSETTEDIGRRNNQSE